MVYIYDACDQISDFCHQQLLRKMRRKISWTDGQTDRGKTVYPPSPFGEWGYKYNVQVTFLDPSDSYFLFADLVGFYTHWTYMNIFRHIFLSNYWWQRSDIWSQASYRYPILCEAFYMKLVTKYQISVINSCWEKCDEKCAYMFNVYKDQLSRQTGSRNLTGPKTLPTIWYTYMM
jgi:hypothetical protein